MDSRDFHKALINAISLSIVKIPREQLVVFLRKNTGMQQFASITAPVLVKKIEEYLQTCTCEQLHSSMYSRILYNIANPTKLKMCNDDIKLSKYDFMNDVSENPLDSIPFIFGMQSDYESIKYIRSLTSRVVQYAYDSYVNAQYVPTINIQKCTRGQLIKHMEEYKLNITKVKKLPQFRLRSYLENIAEFYPKTSAYDNSNLHVRLTNHAKTMGKIAETEFAYVSYKILNIFDAIGFMCELWSTYEAITFIYKQPGDSIIKVVYDDFLHSMMKIQ